MGGSRFEPTVEELITTHLKNKIVGIPCDIDHIVEAEIYGAEKTPWEAFGNHLPWQPFVDRMGARHDSCNFLYVFTRLCNVGKVGTKRKSRVAGIGCWSGNARFTTLSNANSMKIGYSRSFTYETHDKEIQTLGHWTMTEYSINPEIHPELRGSKCDTLVICKIKREDNKCSKAGMVAKDDHQHPKKKPRFTQVGDEQVIDGEVVNMPIGAVDEALVIDAEVLDVPNGNVVMMDQNCNVDLPLINDAEVLDMPNGNVVMMDQNCNVDLLENCPNHHVVAVPYDFQVEDLLDPDLSFNPDDYFLSDLAGVG